MDCIELIAINASTLMALIFAFTWVKTLCSQCYLRHSFMLLFCAWFQHCCPLSSVCSYFNAQDAVITVVCFQFPLRKLITFTFFLVCLWVWPKQNILFKVINNDYWVTERTTCQGSLLISGIYLLIAFFFAFVSLNFTACFYFSSFRRRMRVSCRWTKCTSRVFHVFFWISD